MEINSGRYVNGAGNEQLIYATYGYTQNGQKSFEADANGNVTELLYDGFDRLTRMNYPSTSVSRTKAPCAATLQVYTGASGGTGSAGCANPQPYTTRGAPPSGALINPTPLLGNVNTASDTTGDYETFGYDNGGNKTAWRRRSGATHAYAYDALNRSWRDTPSSGQAVVTVYDLLGRVCDKIFTSDTWSSGNDCDARYTAVTTAGIHNKYDKAGRLVVTKDANARVMSYALNAAGGRTRLTYPDGVYVGYTLDVLNRVTSAGLNASSGLFAQAYNNSGRRISLTRGAGTTSYAYDGLDRLEQLSHNFAGTDQDVTWGFVYNPASQIQSMSSNTGLYDYVQKDKPLESRSYDGLNRDTAVTAVTGGYDSNGNLANEGTGGRAMTYDIDNRLLTLVRSSTGLNATLVYDPMGRLSSYTRNGTVTQFLYDGVNLVGEYDGSGTLLRRYVHGTGVDEPLVWYENVSGSMETRFLYANYQGSVIAWTDGAGVMQDYYKYDPYGLPYNNNNIAPTWTGSRFRYTGQTMLDSAELYYYKARVYDPAYGRFLQTDPIGSEDDLNLYAYVGGDPINKMDTTGLSPNKRQAVSASNIGATYAEYKTLQATLDAHTKTRLNKYFYTDKYGWVDFKHFTRSAQLIADEGKSDAVATVLGYGMEAVEAIGETASDSDYNSGFSYEDLVSNKAGREFGTYIKKNNGNISNAWAEWSEGSGAREIDESDKSAPIGSLPNDDGGRKKHLQRSFTGGGKSSPDEQHPSGECHKIDAGAGVSCTF